MADTHQSAEQATHETTPGMRRNSDPALEPEHQHTHEHLHHAPGVKPANDVIYAKGSEIPLHKHEDGAGSGTPPEYSDNEKPQPGILAQHDVEAQAQLHSPFYNFYYHGPGRLIVHLFFLFLFTGWWMASLILHHSDKNWIVPFLVWLCVTLRIFFWHFSSRHISNAIRTVWAHTAVVVYNKIPANMRTLAGAFVTIATMLVGSFVTKESENNTRANRAISLLGMAIILFAFYLSSANRRRINWRTVIAGMLAQYLIGLFVLRTGAGYSIFRFIADRAGDLLGFAADGVKFLTDKPTSELHWFFIGVVPAIIFFISLVQVLYYVGFLQWFIKKFATFVFWALGVSGAEAVVAAATPFIGQGESAMLVRPFVPHMTNAEIHQILTCGFATISGSVLVGYIGLGLNKEALVSSCIMSIPASLAISKLRYPETEETLTAGRVVIPDDDEHKAENFLHAFANGAWLGIKIGGTIVASLLCIIAVVGLINGLLTWWGSYLDINSPKLTLQTILGYILFPVAFLLGVPQNTHELLSVSRLIAEKIITNEYNAFVALTTDKNYADLSPRSQLIATYALCGFGNIGSLGIQIGILSQLAPSRAGSVSRLALSALISGVFSTLTSAAIAGLVVTDQTTLNRFVDLRVLLPANGATQLSDEPTGELPLNRLDWAIAGTTISEAATAPTGESIRRSTFSHWVSSRDTDPAGVSDVGDMYPQEDGTTLEKGEMLNPATGRLTQYDELWLDLLPPTSDFIAVLKIDAGAVQGMLVWIGSLCQALVRDEDGVSLERWERNDDEAWTRTVRMGARELPCESVLNAKVTLEKDGAVACQGDMWQVIEL